MTRKMRSLFAVVGVLIFSNSILLQAGVIPGRWEKLDVQAPGTGLKVTLKAGDRIEGTFKGSGQDSLTLAETSAGERRILKVDVGRVETSRKVHDSVKDGALKGFAGGAIAGGIFFGFIEGVLGARLERAVRPKMGALLLGAIGAGIGGGGGAAIGLAVDHAVERPEVLYVAK